MKFTAILLCTLFTACTTFVGKHPSPYDEYGEPPADVAHSFELANDTVVAMFSLEERFICSGFWVNDLIITAEHCRIPDEESILFSSYGVFNTENSFWEDKWEATLVFANESQDVAVYAPDAEPPPHTNLEIASRRLYKGETVFAFGHPYGFGYFYSRGYVVEESKVGGLHPDQKWSFISAPLYPGMSGGPVLNYDGDVVGINSFSLYDRDELSGVTHLVVLQGLRDHWNVL